MKRPRKQDYIIGANNIAKALQNRVAYSYALELYIDHLEELKSDLLHNVSNQKELLMSTLTSRVLTIQSEPDGIVRETMINNLLVDINCG